MYEFILEVSNIISATASSDVSLFVPVGFHVPIDTGDK